MKEYAQPLELDSEVLARTSKASVTAQISSPEERAKFYFELAKIQAKRGDLEDCLRCLKIVKDNGSRELANVYRDERFSRLSNDSRLHKVVPPPQSK